MRYVRVFAFAVALLAMLFACGGDESVTTKEAGLQIILTTDLAQPKDIDRIQIDVNQAGANGQFDSPIATKSFRVPDEARLPSTFGIGAGAADDTLARVRVTGFLGAKPVVIRELSIKVPSTRVAVVELELSYACRDQVKITNGSPEPSCAKAGESCQPTTGQCASSYVEVGALPTYVPGTEADAGKIIHVDLDAGKSDAPPIVTNEAGPGEDVVAPKSSEKSIRSFTVAGARASIDVRSISLILPHGTDLTKITPVIDYVGEKLSPVSNAEQDFTKPVDYTVTAADGSTIIYTASLTAASDSAKAITQFTVLDRDATIDEQNGTIALLLPAGTDRTHLAPKVYITGASVVPASEDVHDFTTPIKYTVTAADHSTREYTVTVKLAPSTSKFISAFKIDGVAGAIDPLNHTINVAFTTGHDLKALRPDITFTGASIVPANQEVKDFTNPVVYTVTAEDTTTQEYAVTVTRPMAATPVFDPPNGTYGQGERGSVTITSTTPGAVIQYTASYTTGSGPTYAGPFPMPTSVNVVQTLSATATAPGYEPSAPRNVAYQIVSPLFVVQPTTLDFAKTNCGSVAAPKTFTIQNRGGAATWTGALRKSPTPYAFSPAPGSIGAGATITVTVSPNAVPVTTTTSDNFYGDVIDITRDGGGNPYTVTMKQTAQGAILDYSGATSRNFGSVQQGSTSATQTVTVRNTGNVDALVDYNTTSTFLATTGTVTVIVGGSAAASLQFKPKQAQAYSGTFFVSTTAPLCSPLPAAVTLTGSGTPSGK